MSRATKVEVDVVVDLPVAHVRAERATARAARQDITVMREVLSLAGVHAAAAQECEWRLTLALVLDELRSGSSLVIRDASGRDWRIAPAGHAEARSLRRAA
jgi:hypothetical protein